MGLFSFIKNEGAKIFGTEQTSAQQQLERRKAAKAKAAGNEVSSELDAASKLEQTLKDLHLKVEKLKVIVDDDQATVTGKAKDQATKEKVVLVLGNTHGIATVDDQMSVDHETAESKFHTVVKGDTLIKIAMQYYGDANKYVIILEANHPMLTDKNLIYPGQVLRIPQFK